MQHASSQDFCIRSVRAQEYPRVGALIVEAYASLAGMPTPQQQPEYYAMLADVGRRAGHAAIDVSIAVTDAGEVLGSVDFIADMQHYGAGGTASAIAGAAGMRLLAVTAQCRGRGIGSALTRHCIERAQALGRSRLILHTTRAMQVAWSMYERCGFRRFPDIDFAQGTLQVFGFELPLSDRRQVSASGGLPIPELRELSPHLR